MSESFVAFDSKNKNKLFVWGWNEHGNLGLGDTKDRNSI